MLRYALRRLAWAAIILWAIVSLTFIATFLSPIDPAVAYAGLRPNSTAVNEIHREFGLDKPLLIRYELYLTRLIHGDLGNSYSTQQPVLTSILDRAPTTAILAAAGVTVELMIGIPLGLAAAMRRRTIADRAILIFSLIGAVTPAFVLGFLLLYFLAFQLNVFPLGGSDSWQSLVLPALTLGVPGAAWYARMLRSTSLNILGEDYVKLARAKGLPERVVILRHVLKNAVSPIVVMVGSDMGVYLGGVLVVERVFAWPGIGEQAWTAIGFNDIPMVVGTALFAAFFVTIANLAADVTNAAIDPRIRYA